MPEQFFSKMAQAIAASVLGWIFIQLPKISKKETTWLRMFSYLGVSAMIGFICYSVVTFFWPEIPNSFLCSICSLLGAACDRFMPQLLGLAEKAVEKGGNLIIDNMGDDKKPDDK